MYTKIPMKPFVGYDCVLQTHSDGNKYQQVSSAQRNRKSICETNIKCANHQILIAPSPCSLFERYGISMKEILMIMIVLFRFWLNPSLRERFYLFAKRERGKKKKAKHVSQKMVEWYVIIYSFYTWFFREKHPSKNV